MNQMTNYSIGEGGSIENSSKIVVNKKYQIFISSTYSDLIKERNMVYWAILALNQIPAGMELFDASGRKTWEVIRESIDNSDYLVLIIRWKYGSVIEDETGKSISYTEKEFNYAVERQIPVLAFIIADDVPHTSDMEENDPVKAACLINFIEKVKNGRLVKFWHNADELAYMVSRSLAKEIARGDQGGWVRSTEFGKDKKLAEIAFLPKHVQDLETMVAVLKEKNKMLDFQAKLYESMILERTGWTNTLQTHVGKYDMLGAENDIRDLEREADFSTEQRRHEERWKKCAEYKNCYHYIGLCKSGHYLLRSQIVRVRTDQILKEISKSMGMKVIADVIAYDHIHVLVQSDQETAKTKSMLFGGSARRLRQEFPELKMKSESRLWGRIEAIPIQNEKHYEQCVRYIQEHEPWKTNQPA